MADVLAAVAALAARVDVLEEENRTLKTRLDGRQRNGHNVEAAYADRGGVDGEARALPHLGALPGDPVLLEAIESELRHLAKRLDSNALEDQKAKLLQVTRDEQQDELLKMEFLKISREVEGRASTEAVRKVKSALTAKMEDVLEDASSIAKQQVEVSSQNVAQSIASLTKISEKGMASVKAIERRCVELEARLTHQDSNLDDLASSTTQLSLEQRKTDEKAKRALRGSFDLGEEMRERPASKDVLTRMAVVEARLDDGFLRRKKRRGLAPDGTVIDRTALDELDVTDASLKDVKMLRDELVSRITIAEESSRASSKSIRRARELDEDAQNAKIESADAALKALAARLVKGEVQREAMARTLRGSTDELVSLKQLKERVRAVETAVEGIDWSQLVAASKQYSDDGCARQKARVDADLLALSERVEATFGTSRDEVLAQTGQLMDRVATLQQRAEASTHASTRAEERCGACEENVEEVAQRALQQVAGARAALLSDVAAAADAVLATKEKAEVVLNVLEARWTGHARDYDDAMARLHRSLVAQAISIKQVKHQCASVTLQDMAGDRLDAILDAHVGELAKHCVVAEAAVISEREMSLPVNEQKWLASTIQQCAEKLAQRADLECLRGLIGHTDKPETNDLWDKQLETNRARLLASFCERLDDAASKMHPTFNSMAEATRRRFNERLKLCLRVGLSKHSPVQPNMTLFGKTKLGPACVACDRPFDGPNDADFAIAALVDVAAPVVVERRAPRLKRGTLVQRAAPKAPDEMFFPDVGSPVR